MVCSTQAASWFEVWIGAWMTKAATLTPWRLVELVAFGVDLHELEP